MKKRHRKIDYIEDTQEYFKALTGDMKAMDATVLVLNNPNFSDEECEKILIEIGWVKPKIVMKFRRIGPCTTVKRILEFYAA